MKQARNYYSESFKHEVLDAYFRSGLSQHEFARRHQLHANTLNTWINVCRNADNSVTLQSNSIHMDAKDQAIENLRVENERLRREVELQKLKVAGYERLIEIVRHEDGIDLLKKDGAKQ